MKTWLKTTLARIIIVGLVATLLAWFFIYRPVSQAKQLVKSQKSASAQNLDALNKISQALASVPSLADIKAQQLGAINSYADQVRQASTALSKLNIVRPRGLSKISGLDWGKNGQIVVSVNQTIPTANELNSKSNFFTDWTIAKELASYHAQISKALVNILEYNPTVDTANFTLGSEDTNQRLNLAAQGLAKTISSLQAEQDKYNDSTFSEVINQIQLLQQARDQLAKDGNTASWINVVSQAQAKIILNRSSFWQSQKKQINNSLDQNISVLAQYQKLWNELAIKYKL